MPLEQIYLNSSWHAAYFTPGSYSRALSVKTQQQITDAALAKERKAKTAADDKANKAKEVASKKAAKPVSRSTKRKRTLSGRESSWRAARRWSTGALSALRHADPPA